jgi:hypothetical protein
MTDLAASPARRSPISLWPKEHGAYVQLALPLLAAWLLGAPRLDAFLLGVAAFVAFVAHEPLMLMTGRRGERKRDATRGRAERRLVWLAAVAAALGGFAFGLTVPVARVAIAGPACLGAIAVLLAATGRERSLLGEVWVTASLTSVSLPVALASGLGLERSITMVLVWAAGFAVATVAARGVLFQKKDRGRGLRLAIVWAVLLAVACLALTAFGIVDPWIALAPLPFAAAATLIAMRPPSPKRMHALGFALVAAGLLSLLLLSHTA